MYNVNTSITTLVTDLSLLKLSLSLPLNLLLPPKTSDPKREVTLLICFIIIIILNETTDYRERFT